MTAYLLRRLLFLVPLIFGVTFLTFVLAKALPGDPVDSLAGERSDPATIEKIRREIGDDRDFVRQYAGYLSLLLQGELGRSYFTNRRVADDLREKLPNTMLLAVSAMVLAVPIGIGLGMLGAARSGSMIDRMITGCAALGLSMPVFWSGLLLMLLLSLTLGLVPPAGTGGLRYLLLPSVTLAIPALASISRITRTAVVDIGDAPFVRTARAKGLRWQGLYLTHILRNALIPVLTVVGLEFGSYLNGAVLTETIFGWNGIGRFVMEGILKRDYPVIMGCILVGTIVFVLTNLAVDLALHAIDPRLRDDGKSR